jgi:hypothetical protein
MRHIYLCHVALDSWEVISGMVIAVLGFAVTFCRVQKKQPDEKGLNFLKIL